MNEASNNTCGRCGALPMIPHDPGCHAPCILRDNRYRAQIRDLVRHLDGLLAEQGVEEDGSYGSALARAAEDFLTRNNFLENA